MTRSHRALVAAFAFAVVGGCSDSDTQAPTPPQKYSGASVQEIPENVLAAAVLIRAEAYDSAYIEYHNGTGRLVRTPAVDIEGTPWLGSRSGTRHRDGLYLSSGSCQGGNGRPDRGFPPIHQRVTPNMDSGHRQHRQCRSTWLPGPVAAPRRVIVDNTGKVVWYRYIGAGSLLVPGTTHWAPIPSSETAPPRRNFCYSILSERRAACSVVSAADAIPRTPGERRWRGLAAVRRDSHHEPHGRRGCGSGHGDWHRGPAAVGRRDAPMGMEAPSTISRLPTSRWRIAPARLVNFTHGNGLGFDSDSNLILGFRSLNEVTKVDRSTGAIIWRFGGLRNQFTVLNDPKGVFEHQHGVRWAGPGQVQLLDRWPLGAEPPRALPARHLGNDCDARMGVHRRANYFHRGRWKHPVPSRWTRYGGVRPGG